MNRRAESYCGTHCLPRIMSGSVSPKLYVTGSASQLGDDDNEMPEMYEVCFKALRAPHITEKVVRGSGSSGLTMLPAVH